MAVALLVIGALMSGAGIYAVIYGYSIIQVEEGWASVISGATLVAGGVITIALGLVLRVLKQVQTGLLETPARVAPDVADPAPALPLVAGMETPDAPAENPSELAAAASAVAQEPNRLTFAANVDTPVAPSVPLRAHEPSFQFPTIAPSPNVPKSTDAIPHETHDPEPDVPAPPQEQPPAASARPADDYKLETPSTPEHDLPHKGPHEVEKTHEAPSLPATDDWLDRAFAELDRDNPPWPPRKLQPEPRTADVGAADDRPVPQSVSVQPPLPLEPAGAEQGPDRAEPEDAQTKPQASASPGAPAQSPVIGRYESDGTTYVMFADGSIEAQSASGVYRFASMAELKTYIEK